MAYDCFISYSHRSDSVVAPAIEHGLERLARPWYRLHALQVFRDETDLSLTPSLWGEIGVALDGARFFVLLASPQSAASEWVNKEIARWCDAKGTANLFIVVTAGELDWDDHTGDFSASSTAVAPALRGRFASEPLYLDLRWVAEVPDLSLRLSRFRAAIASIASPMRGLPPDELEGEDIRLHRRARRLARAAVSALVVLAVAASVAAVLAVVNAHRAVREARVALARQVGLEAIDLPASALDRAFLLSLASSGLEGGSDPTRFRSTRTLIGRFSRLDRIRSTETAAGSTSVRSVALAADGTLAGSVLTFDAAQGTAITDVLQWPEGVGAPRRTASPIGAGEVAFVGATNDDLVLRSGDAALLVTAGAEPRPLPGQVSAIRPDLARAVTIDGGMARLVDLADGRALAEAPVDGPATATLHRDVAVIVAGNRMALFDARSGQLTGDVALPTAAPVVRVEATEDGAAVATIEQAEATVVLRVWHRQTDGALTTADPVALDVGPDTIRQTALAPDGARLLVVTDRRTLLVPTAGGPPVADEGGVGVVAVDRSGRYVAVGGPRLAIWDLLTGQRPIAVPERVSAVAWGGSCAPSGPCVLATVGSGLDVWDPAALTHQRLAMDTNAQAVAVTPDGATISSAGWGEAVAVWGLRSRPDADSRRELTPAGALTAFDPRSRLLVRVTNGTAQLRVLPAGPSSEQESRTRPAASIEVGDVDRIVLLPGGRRMLTVAGHEVRLWDTASARSVPLDPACDGDLLATSPDGTLVASWRRRDGLVAECDARTGARRTEAALGLAAPSALAVDDDGSVAVGTETGALSRYPLVGGALRPGIQVSTGFGGEQLQVTALAVAPGRLAAGLSPIGDDAGTGRVLVWDVARNGEPIVFDVDQREVAALALTGDGALLSVAGRDLADGSVTVQVWESATRRRVGRALDGLTGTVTQLSGDDQELIGVDLSGRTVRWLLGTDPRREVCAIVARPLRPDEWKAAAAGALGGEEFAAQCRAG
jgi:hypothetical protein